MGVAMVTKISNRKYQFHGVQFEPENNNLIWDDQTITPLTHEESRTLEVLCHHAGEVISTQAIFLSASLPDTGFNQFQNSLYTLLAKSYRAGKKTLPIEFHEEFGYRIGLPIQNKPQVKQSITAQSPRDLNAQSPPEKSLRKCQPKLNRSYWVALGICVTAGVLLVISQ